MNEEQTRACPQDCRKCGLHQHAYCAAQMAYTALSTIQELSSRVSSIEEKMESLSASAEELISPMTAQEGSGAE